MSIETPRAGTWSGQIRNWSYQTMFLAFVSAVGACCRAAWWAGSTWRTVTIPVGCALGLGGGLSWLPVAWLPVVGDSAAWVLDGNVPAVVWGPVLVAGVGFVVVSSPPWWQAEVERMDRRTVSRFWWLRNHYPIRWAGGNAVAITRRTGTLVPNPIPDSHVLVAGTTGAGKSWAITAILWPLAANPHVHMVAIDLKRGMELGPWGARLDLPVARDPAGALDMLRAVQAFIDARAEALEAAELDDCPPPCAEWPHVVVVCDELARLMRFEKESGGLFTTAVEQGRACGVWFLIAAQSPKADVIPTEFRDLLNTILCGAASANMADVISGGLGPDSRKRLGDSHPANWDVRPRYDRKGNKRAGPDAGRFLLIDGGETEVRMVGHPKSDVRARAAQYASVAARPVVQPYVVSAEPTEKWLRRDLIAAARARGVPLPDDVDDNHRRYPKREILAMMGVEAA